MNDRRFAEFAGTLGLAVCAVVALTLSFLRQPTVSPERLTRIRRLFLVGLGAQGLHASEEFLTHFYERFPMVLGLAPWSPRFFIALNASCLLMWLVSVKSLRTQNRFAFFPIWFFAVTASANGVAHPPLALAVGGYFPGLVTSPAVGAIGAWLLYRLFSVTESRHDGISRQDMGLILKDVIFTIVVPGTVAYWLPRYAFDLWRVSAHPPPLWRFVSVVPLTLGCVIYLRCVWDFAARGRGIPAPLSHPKQLVVTGLYQYVRNPMYVGVLLVLVGETLYFQSFDWLLYTAGWLLFVHANILVYEEPNLRRKFGSSYEQYTASVRRWIPGRRYKPIRQPAAES